MHDTPKVIAFGEFELDFERSELRRAGELVALQPTPLRVLLHLAEQRGRTVPRQELFDAVWPGVVVGDDALTRALMEVRRAVGDHADEQRVIRTLKGLGYRFVAKVQGEDTDAARARVAEAPAEASGMAPGHAAALPASSARQRTGRRAWLAAAALTLGIGSLAATWLLSPSGPPPPFGIAVLPIQPLTPSAADQELADGLTEQITQALAEVGYPVVARTTASVWRERAVDVRDLGAKLGISHLLEGSVRREQERLRVSMQLVSTDTGKHVWSEGFEEIGSDAFAIQDRVTNRVVTQVFKLVSADVAAAKGSPDLAQFADSLAASRPLFLEGRWLDYLAAAERLLASVPDDPTYGRLRGEIHARMAVAWSRLYWMGGEKSFDELGSHILTQAEKAVALSPDSPRAHAALAEALVHSWRWEEAEAEMHRVCELAPRDGPTCGWARFLVCGALGCLREHLEGARMWVRGAPADARAWSVLSIALMNDRQLEEAESAALRASELVEVSGSVLPDVQWRLGKRDQAVASLHRMFLSLGANSRDSGDESLARGVERVRPAGPEAVWRWIGDEMDHGALAARFPYTNDFLAANHYAELGDFERVLTALERSVAEHEAGLQLNAIDPIYDPIRDGRRFRALMEKMGLAAYHAKYLRRGRGPR